MSLMSFLQGKNTNYPQIGDPKAQEEYMKKKMAKNASSNTKISMNDSWNFLRTLADLIDKGFSKADKDSIEQYGSLLSKYGAKYIHDKKYAVLEQNFTQQAKSQSGSEISR